MSTETKEAPPAVEGMSIVLPPHLAENFEKASRQIEDSYGKTPGVSALVRLWLASSTSSQIRKEFELAVLDISKRGIVPNKNGEFDDDCL